MAIFGFGEFCIVRRQRLMSSAPGMNSQAADGSPEADGGGGISPVRARKSRKPAAAGAAAPNPAWPTAPATTRAIQPLRFFAGVGIDGLISVEIDGFDAESKASAVARERDGLSWEEYSVLLQRYLSHVEFLFSPELFIIGGGISKRADEYLPRLLLRTPIVPAKLKNDAGIVGAALEIALKHWRCLGLR